MLIARRDMPLSDAGTFSGRCATWKRPRRDPANLGKRSRQCRVQTFFFVKKEARPGQQLPKSRQTKLKWRCTLQHQSKAPGGPVRRRNNLSRYKAQDLETSQTRRCARYTFPSPGSRPPGSPGHVANNDWYQCRQEHVPAWKDSQPLHDVRLREHVGGPSLDASSRGLLPSSAHPTSGPHADCSTTLHHLGCSGAAPLRAAARESGSTVRRLVMLISNGSRRRRRRLFLTRQQFLCGSSAEHRESIWSRSAY